MRIINHKQPFHDGYYNKVRWIINLGAELLYNNITRVKLWNIVGFISLTNDSE
jgi:hypothetical protein